MSIDTVTLNMTKIKSSSAWRPPPKAMVKLQVGEESDIKNIEASQLLDSKGNLSYEKLLEYSVRNSGLNKNQDTSQINWNVHRDEILSNYDISTLYLDDNSNWVIFSSDNEFVEAFKKAEQKAKAFGKPIFPKFSCYSIKNWRKGNMFQKSSYAMTILKCKSKTEKKKSWSGKKARKVPKILKEFESCVLTVGEFVHNIIEETIRLQQKITKDIAHVAISSNANKSCKNRDLVLTEDVSGVVLLTFIDGFSPKNVLEVVTELGSTIDTWVLAVGEAVHNVVEGSICLGKSMNIKRNTNRMLKNIVSTTVEVFTDDFDEPPKIKRVDVPKKYFEVRYRSEMVESKILASDFTVSVAESPKPPSTKRIKTAPLLSDMLMVSCSNGMGQCDGFIGGQPSAKDLNSFASWYKAATEVQTQKKKDDNLIPVKKHRRYVGTENGTLANKDLELFLSFLSTCKSKLGPPKFVNTFDKGIITNKEFEKLSWCFTSEIFSKKKNKIKVCQETVPGRMRDVSLKRFLAWWSPLEKQIRSPIVSKEKINRKRSHNEFKQTCKSSKKNEVKGKNYDDDDNGKLSDEALEQFLSRWSTPGKRAPHGPMDNSNKSKMMPKVVGVKTEEKVVQLRDTADNEDDEKLSDEALEQFISWWSTPLNNVCHDLKKETGKKNTILSILTVNKDDQSGQLSDANFDLFLTWWSTSEKTRPSFASKTRDIFSKRISNLPRKQNGKVNLQSNEDFFQTKDNVLAKFVTWCSASTMTLKESNSKNVSTRANNGQLSDDDFNRFLTFWAPDVKPVFKENVQADQQKDNNRGFLQDEDSKQFEYWKSQEISTENHSDGDVDDSSVTKHINSSDKESDDMSVSDLETISEVSAHTMKNERNEERAIVGDIEIVLTDALTGAQTEEFKSVLHEISDDEWSDDFDFDVQSVESPLSEENLVPSIVSNESDVLVKAPSKSDEVISIKSADNQDDGDGFSLISEQDFISDASISFISDVEFTESINSGL